MILAKVSSQLGQGGRGRVFEAKISEGQVVTLKVVRYTMLYLLQFKTYINDCYSIKRIKNFILEKSK
jgi:hypothetical protein